MIVEFIGSTGAGKTTLMQAVLSRLSQNTSVSDCAELLTRRLGLRHIANPTLRNLIQEVAGLPLFIAVLHRHQAFLTYVFRLLSRRSPFSMSMLNNLRSLVRKVSMYETARRQTVDKIVLMDEGPLLAAHMFAYGPGACTPAEIDHFASVVPLPDLIIYVQAPPESLVERSLRRTDPPREMRLRGPIEVEGCTERATAIFDRLVRTPELRSRVTAVKNPEAPIQEKDKVVDAVTRIILGLASSAGRA